MANTTVPVPMATTPWGDSKISLVPSTATATYYPGAMIAVDATDYAVKCDDTAGLLFMGINCESADFVVTASGPSRSYMLVDRPWRFTALIASASAGDTGLAVYAKYDNEVAYAAGVTNDILVGWVDKVLDSTHVSVNPIYGPLANLAVANNTLTFAGATGANTIVMPDNLADALSVVQGATPYLTFVTTTGATRVLVSKQMKFADSVKIAFGDADDITMAWDGTDFDVLQATANSSIKLGISGAGIDLVLYGDTAGYNLTWDQSADALLFDDNAKLAIGTGSDIVLAWDATRLNVTQAATNSEIRWGVDGAGIDQRWYTDTASAYVLLDQSADAMVFGGVAGITNLKVKQSTAVAITGATTLVLADSGGIFTLSQAAAYDVDLPSPTTGAGASYFFSVTAPGANNVTITVDGSAATFVGSIITEGQIIVATGSTLTIASGVAVLGDSIEIRSIATNLYHVRAVSSILNGITVA